MTTTTASSTTTVLESPWSMVFKVEDLKQKTTIPIILFHE